MGRALIRPLLFAALVAGACGRAPEPAASRPARELPDSAKANRQAMVLNDRACRLRDAYDYDSALVLYHEALAIGSEYRLQRRIFASLLGIGTCHAELMPPNEGAASDSHFAAARDYFTRARQLAADSTLRDLLPAALSELALLYYLSERPEYRRPAESLLVRARDEAARTGQREDAALALYHLAQLHARRAGEGGSPVRMRAAAVEAESAAAELRRCGQLQTARAADAMAEDMYQVVRELETR